MDSMPRTIEVAVSYVLNLMQRSAARKYRAGANDSGEDEAAGGGAE